MFWDPLRYTVIRESIRGGPALETLADAAGAMGEEIEALPVAPAAPVPE